MGKGVEVVTPVPMSIDLSGNRADTDAMQSIRGLPSMYDQAGVTGSFASVRSMVLPRLCTDCSAMYPSRKRVDLLTCGSSSFN